MMRLFGTMQQAAVAFYIAQLPVLLKRLKLAPGTKLLMKLRFLKASSFLLRGLIGSSRNIDWHHSGMLIAFIGIPTKSAKTDHQPDFLQIITPQMSRKKDMAERVGFEPTVRFPVRSLSRRVLSTAQSPLRGHPPS